MASARSLLALVPAAAAVPVIGASSSHRRRISAGLNNSHALSSSSSSSGEGVVSLLQSKSRGLHGRSPASSSSSLKSLCGKGGALASSLLVLVASSAANLAMAVAAEEEKEKTVVTESNGLTVTELLTEFMVKMSCEGCVKSVRSKLEPLEGVKSVDIDLQNQVVRILGSAPIKNLTSAIEQSGRDARLIGQGLPSDFAISAAVAEFKGPEINGVVRFAQVSMELAKIDASFSGLTPGSHAWSINTYGDLTRGAASTGGVFEAESSNSSGSKDKPMGDLGVLDVNDKGEVDYSGAKQGLQVSELIGRAVVLYANNDTSQEGITASVIARSAGVGENYKKLCSCDGTVIWESSNNDFVKV
ncbi:unnamed protein product [Calypogeia fissa]